MIYTPGPWKYKQPDYDKMRNLPCTRLEVRAERNGIHKPYVADVRSIGPDGEDNTEANARLIAAAPELLEALEAMCAAPLLIDCNLPGVTLEAKQRAMAAYKQARTAIAKASGQ